MQNYFKRAIAVIALFAMMTTLLPQTAVSAFAKGGDITVEDGITVEEKDDITIVDEKDKDGSYLVDVSEGHDDEIVIQPEEQASDDGSKEITIGGDAAEDIEVNDTRSDEEIKIDEQASDLASNGAESLATMDTENRLIVNVKGDDTTDLMTEIAKSDVQCDVAALDGAAILSFNSEADMKEMADTLESLKSVKSVEEDAEVAIQTSDVSIGEGSAIQMDKDALETETEAGGDATSFDDVSILQEAEAAADGTSDVLIGSSAAEDVTATDSEGNEIFYAPDAANDEYTDSSANQDAVSSEVADSLDASESIAQAESLADTEDSNISVEEALEDKTIIALIDTGVNGIDNIDLTGEGDGDANGHGTRMAGEMQSIIGDKKDIKILSIKAIGENGRGNLSNIYAAVQVAIDNHANIINMSFAMNDNDNTKAVREIIKTAQDAGIKVIAAAGNQGSDASCYFPANADDVITVGAADADGKVRDLSNTGDLVEWYAYAQATSDATAKASALYAVNGKLETIDGTIWAAEDVKSDIELMDSDIAYILKHANREYTGDADELLGSGFFTVTHFLVDASDLAEDERTIDGFWKVDEDGDGESDNAGNVLGEVPNVHILYELGADSKYYVGHVITMESDTAPITDWITSLNDTLGHGIDDMIYDPDTDLVYVPKTYVKAENNFNNVRIQLMYALDDESELNFDFMNNTMQAGDGEEVAIQANPRNINTKETPWMLTTKDSDDKGIKIGDKFVISASVKPWKDRDTTKSYLEPYYPVAYKSGDFANWSPTIMNGSNTTVGDMLEEIADGIGATASACAKIKKGTATVRRGGKNGAKGTKVGKMKITTTTYLRLLCTHSNISTKYDVGTYSNSGGTYNYGSVNSCMCRVIAVGKATEQDINGNDVEVRKLVVSINSPTIWTQPGAGIFEVYYGKVITTEPEITLTKRNDPVLENYTTNVTFHVTNMTKNKSADVTVTVPAGKPAGDVDLMEESALAIENGNEIKITEKSIKCKWSDANADEEDEYTDGEDFAYTPDKFDKTWYVNDEEVTASKTTYDDDTVTIKAKKEDDVEIECENYRPTVNLKLTKTLGDEQATAVEDKNFLFLIYNNETGDIYSRVLTVKKGELTATKTLSNVPFGYYQVREYQPKNEDDASHSDSKYNLQELGVDFDEWAGQYESIIDYDAALEVRHGEYFTNDFTTLNEKYPGEEEVKGNKSYVDTDWDIAYVHANQPGMTAEVVCENTAEDNEGYLRLQKKYKDGKTCSIPRTFTIGVYSDQACTQLVQGSGIQNPVSLTIAAGESESPVSDPIGPLEANRLYYVKEISGGTPSMYYDAPSAGGGSREEYGEVFVYPGGRYSIWDLVDDPEEDLSTWRFEHGFAYTSVGSSDDDTFQQCTVVVENPATVPITIVKKSIDADGVTNGHPLYDMTGTEYTLYTNEECTTIAKDGNTGEDAIFRCQSYDRSTSTAKFNTINVFPGTYWLLETKAGPGYMRDTRPVKITIDGEVTSITPNDSKSQIINNTGDPRNNGKRFYP